MQSIVTLKFYSASQSRANLICVVRNHVKLPLSRTYAGGAVGSETLEFDETVCI